jgi:hypothetical protein
VILTVTKEITDFTMLDETLPLPETQLQKLVNLTDPPSKSGVPVSKDGFVHA